MNPPESSKGVREKDEFIKIKNKIIFSIIAFGIILVSSFIIYLNFFQDRNLRNSDQIHIIDNSGWIEFRNAGKCTGSGTILDPYVIKDLYIENDDPIHIKYCIWIEDSNAFFIIKNCFLFTPFRFPEFRIGSGIKLTNVANFQLVDNICQHNGVGIYLDNCNDGNITGNYLSVNDHGLLVEDCTNVNLTENNLERNSGWHRGGGIILLNNLWINCRKNLMNECGLKVKGSLYNLNSYNIDATNLVNGKPLYYYINQINLGPINFSNAGQVLLVNCSNPLISNLNLLSGLVLHYCNNNTISGNQKNIVLHNVNKNTISGNIANYNDYGIYLENSDNNNITGNFANDNHYGIYLEYRDNNNITGNIANYNYDGIYLENSYNNNITGNIANSNKDDGINIYRSNYNIITKN
ncbi:MAG: nitrous oxide reductase family maturation protein NosD, partial [Promethearchaeota archaeon]